MLLSRHHYQSNRGTRPLQQHTAQAFRPPQSFRAAKLQRTTSHVARYKADSDTDASNASGHEAAAEAEMLTSASIAAASGTDMHESAQRGRSSAGLKKLKAEVDGMASK